MTFDSLKKFKKFIEVRYKRYSLVSLTVTGKYIRALLYLEGSKYQYQYKEIIIDRFKMKDKWYYSIIRSFNYLSFNSTSLSGEAI